MHHRLLRVRLELHRVPLQEQLGEEIQRDHLQLEGVHHTFQRQVVHQNLQSRLVQERVLQTNRLVLGERQRLELLQDFQRVHRLQVLEHQRGQKGLQLVLQKDHREQVLEHQTNRLVLEQVIQTNHQLVLAHQRQELQL